MPEKLPLRTRREAAPRIKRPRNARQKQNKRKGEFV